MVMNGCAWPGANAALRHGLEEAGYLVVRVHGVEVGCDERRAVWVAVATGEVLDPVAAKELLQGGNG